MKKLVTICVLYFLTAGFAWSQGAGNALEFDASDYVNCGNNSSLKPSDVLTIEAWVRPDNDVVFGGGTGIVFSDGDETTTGVNLTISTDYIPRCYVLTDAGVKTISGLAVTVDPVTWVHLCLVFNGSSLKLYVDGTEYSTTFAATDISTNSNNFIIGGRPSDSDRRFLGDIDEVRFWHAALSQATIQAWMNKPVTALHPNYASMVSYWKFDEDMIGETEGTCDDSKGTNDGSNLGALWFANNDLTLPVKLAGLQAVPTADKKSIELSWTTQSEENNVGFAVLRRNANGQSWQTIADYRTAPELAGQGTITQQTTYRYADTNVDLNTHYQYCVAAIDIYGDRQYSQVIHISLAEVLISNFKLQAAYPNPFNPSTTIVFDVLKESPVDMKIVDVTGRTVRNLLTGEIYYSGQYELSWNGLTDHGVPAAAGVYFVVMNADSYSGSLKLLLLK
ncbi:MAG TPA: FlgD immunoglobulin-like domain containing protein [bacterium]|nr:FlgD immunoglobulin-like domain containing protein [bacterium]HPN42195.1 FlgD immunoglobulin-like domain containing protein [bacterium]